MNKILVPILGTLLLLAFIPFGFLAVLIRVIADILDWVEDTFETAWEVTRDLDKEE